MIAIVISAMVVAMIIIVGIGVVIFICMPNCCLCWLRLAEELDGTGDCRGPGIGSSQQRPASCPCVCPPTSPPPPRMGSIIVTVTVTMMIVIMIGSSNDKSNLSNSFG